MIANRYELTLDGYSSADADLTITVRSAGGDLKGTWQCTSNSIGHFSQYLDTGDPSHPLVLVTGDQIRVTPNAGAPFNVTFPRLTISPDLAASTVSGLAWSGAAITLRIEREGPAGTVYFTQNTLADPDGSYTLSLAGKGGLQQGDQVTVSAADADGNTFVDTIVLPNRIQLYTTDNILDGMTSPNTSIDIAIRDELGRLKHDFQALSDRHGRYRPELKGAFLPGDKLTVSAAGKVTDLTVVPLAIDQLDRDANLVGGAGPAGQTIHIGVNGKDYPAHVDENGRFHLDLSGSEKLTGNQSILIGYQTAPGAVQEAQVFTPYLELDGTSAPIVSGPRGSQMVGVLKTSAGAIRASCQEPMPSGIAVCDLGLIPAAGDVFTWSLLGGTYHLTIPQFTLNLDTAESIASGFAPANTQLSASEFTLTSGSGMVSGSSQGDGSYSFDFSALDPPVPFTHLTSVEVNFTTLKGDLFYLTSQVPGVWANVSDGSVQGTAAPNAPVSLQLKSGSTLAGSAGPASDGHGKFDAPALCQSGSPAALSPGLDLTSDAGGALSIPAITLVYDPATSTISGSAPANTHLFIWQVGSLIDEMYTADVTTDGSGQFSHQFTDLSEYPALYYQVMWQDADGDMLTKILPANPPPAGTLPALLQPPASLRPGDPVTLRWNFNGKDEDTVAVLEYDTVSHACDRLYGLKSNLSGETPTGGLNLTVPLGQTLYAAVKVTHHGLTYWSPEAAIPISTGGPVITDPISGDTSQNNPPILGFARPGAAVTLFESGSMSVLSQGSAGADGGFQLTLAAPLTSGTHHLFVQSAGENSPTVDLQVDPTLPVDPVHIVFSEEAANYHILDSQGLARLGGQIWARPGNILGLRLPVTCPDAAAVSIQFGTQEISLINEGDGVWGGNFSLPPSSFALTAAITCGSAAPLHVLLTQGIIDPDGFIYDRATGQRVSGAKVTLEALGPGLQAYTEWNAAEWDQINPQVSDGDGQYRFFVLPGTYRLVVSAAGYPTVTSGPIQVTAAPVHFNLALAKPMSVFLPVLRR